MFVFFDKKNVEDV